MARRNVLRLKKYKLPLYASFRWKQKRYFYLFTDAHGYRSSLDTYNLTDTLHTYFEYLELPL